MNASLHVRAVANRLGLNLNTTVVRVAGDSKVVARDGITLVAFAWLTLACTDSTSGDSAACQAYKEALAPYAHCDPEYAPPVVQGSYSAYRCASASELSRRGIGETLADCASYLKNQQYDAGGCIVPLGKERERCTVGFLILDSKATLPSDSVGSACLPEFVPIGGFVATESYVEISNPACPQAACLVRELVGDPSRDCDDTGGLCASPAETKEHVYCTCRCDSADSGAPTCTCPQDFVCASTLLAFGGPGIKGGYCVRAPGK